MAMSDTNSSHTDWVQYYQHNLTEQPTAVHHPHHTAPPMFGHVSSVAESTVVTTMSMAPTATLSPSVSGTTTGSSATHSIMEGRVGKSARRRSRASRKAPTTLLNTDAANFRAMVQQFTGIPSRPFQSATYQGGAPALNFQLSANQFHQPMINPLGVQQQQQQQHYHQYQQPQQHQQHQESIFTLGNNTSDIFVHGFDNPRASHEVSDGFFLEGISPQVMSRPASTDNRTTGGFLL